VSAFDTRFLDCRDMGHAWERASDVVRSNSGGVRSFKRTLKCLRCETMRQDEYKVGDVVTARGRRYAYPKGYQVKGGMSRGEARMLLYYPRVSQPVGIRSASA
jgi:hypothetical protein